MTTSRRDFLDSLALGASALATLPALGTLPTPRGAAHAVPADLRRDVAQGAWDVRWHERLTGTVRTVFDVPEIESGYGVWRASVWARQYQAVLGMAASELSTALVLRHNAIVLAMQQGFWDKYGIGKSRAVTHPVTGAPTDRNPVLMTDTDGLPPVMQASSLPNFIQRGGVALACDVALQDLVALIVDADRVSEAVAQEQAKRWLVPGVILQPSGVFAVLRAQQMKQALYIRAS
ncbi:MAG: hypothetical protein IPJ78_14290 [Gemmatimonadetes bacterium]|nr:hypothetical protein [Gemmatimonadota bacterium]